MISKYLESNKLSSYENTLKSKPFFRSKKDTISLETKFYTFLQYEINKRKPDIIILVERKGTAILRALKEKFDDKFNWSWSKVVSSSIISQLPSHFFQNKKILIFDDMMMRGLHLKDLLNELSKKSLGKLDSKNIHIAVFGVHEESSKRIYNNKIKSFFPNSWFYRDLTTNSYSLLRENIIEMLEKSGSLMLDTEHIEIRIKLSMHFDKFVQAISRSGKSVVFRTSKNLRNITIYYPDDSVHTFKEEIFPPNTCFEKIVKKCRIVQRDHENYAIIPICFPTVNLNKKSKEWFDNSELNKLFGLDFNPKNFSIFYCVALLASLDVLKWVVKDIAASGISKSCFYFPSESTEDIDNGQGYTLNHLKVIYPTINLSKLNKMIYSYYFEGWSDGIKLIKKTFDENKLLKTTDIELNNQATQMLQIIRKILDVRQLQDTINGKEIHHPDGLTTSEIYDISKRLGFKEEERISALFDILIDRADLIPHTQYRTLKNNTTEYFRTFEPDGEIVSNKIRRLTAERGLPCEFRSFK